MAVRSLFLIAAASAALLSAGACAATTTPIGAASPAPLSSAWYTGATPAPTVAPAQVAPGAYQPVPTSTGLFLAASPGVIWAAPGATTPVPATATCTPTLGPATSIPVTATAGTGTLTAHWTDLSDPAVLTYRLAAIPDNGAPTTWLTVAATHTCKTTHVVTDRPALPPTALRLGLIRGSDSRWRFCTTTDDQNPDTDVLPNRL